MRAFESYSKAVQLTIKLFDTGSRPILGPVYATPLFQSFEETRGYDPGLFVECARRCLAQAPHSRPPVIVSEFCGLTVIGTSLVFHGEIAGAAVGGYALLDFFQVSEVQRLAQDSGINFERLWRVVREQRPVPKQRLMLNGELLQVLGDSLLREDRRVREYGEALGRTESQLRALTARLLDSQEEERRRLARELHDDLVQRVVSLQNQVARLRLEQRGSAAGIRGELKAIENELENLAHATRSVSHGLHASILDDLGLAPALKQLVYDFAERNSVTARFQADNIPHTISAAISTNLYRITQEALSNIRRHAPNAAVAATLSCLRTELRLVIEDTGPGFDIKQATKGLGLVNMQERAHLVGGQLIITAGPGQGTRIEVIIPCERTG
jgi:signal transduction histidine kinase